MEESKKEQRQQRRAERREARQERRATRKPFKDSALGKVLAGAVGIVNPALGDLIAGQSTIGEAVKSIITDDQLTPDQKEHFKNLAHQLEIEAFEQEVKDRESARTREVGVLNAGGADVMFKVVGAGILTIWGVLLYALFFGKIDVVEQYNEISLMAFGGVTTYVGHIVSYYYGSSVSSRAKTSMLNDRK